MSPSVVRLHGLHTRIACHNGAQRPRLATGRRNRADGFLNALQAVVFRTALATRRIVETRRVDRTAELRDLRWQRGSCPI